MKLSHLDIRPARTHSLRLASRNPSTNEGTFIKAGLEISPTVSNLHTNLQSSIVFRVSSGGTRACQWGPEVKPVTTVTDRPLWNGTRFRKVPAAAASDSSSCR